MRSTFVAYTWQNDPQNQLSANKTTLKQALIMLNIFTLFFLDDLLLETGDVELKRDQLLTLKNKS